MVDKLFRIFLFLVPLLLVSCTAGILEIEIPFTRPEVVANGLILNERSEIRLTYSVDPNDTIRVNDIPIVTGAVVILFGEDGSQYELSEARQGEYVTNAQLSQGDRFTLTIEAPDENEPTIVRDLVLPPEVLDLRITSTVTTVDESDFIFKRTVFSGVLTYRPQNGELSDMVVKPSFKGGRDYEFVGMTTSFSEDFINACRMVEGKYLSWPGACFISEGEISIPFQCRFETSLNQSTGQIGTVPDSLFLDVLAVQPILNQHLNSLVNSNDAFDQVFTVPNIYVTNVENGFGVVSGATGIQFNFRLR